MVPATELGGCIIFGWGLRDAIWPHDGRGEDGCAEVLMSGE